RKVVCNGLPKRPVLKIYAGVMRVSVVVKDIADGDAPDRHRDAIDVTLAGELIGSVLDGLLLATETKGLTEKVALRAKLWEVTACLLRFAIGETSKTQRASKSKALI